MSLRVFGAGLVALLAFAAVASAQKHPAKHPHRSRKQLAGHLSMVRNHKANLRHQLNVTRHAAKVVVVDIQGIDARIGKVQDQLSDTTDRLDSSREEQVRLAGQVKLTTAELAKNKEQVRSRLRRMYIRGESSIFTALTGLQGAGELAGRQYLLKRIALKDREVFTNYRRLQAQTVAQKRRQDTLVRQISGLVVQEKQQAASLRVARADKHDALVSLKAKQQNLQQAIQEMESDERRILSEIAEYERLSRLGHHGKPLPAFRGRFGRPVNAPITSTFGMRYHPILHRTRLHAGIDFGAPIGAPIYAAADGRVVASGYGSGYGNRIILDHGGGVMTLYGHCSRLMCSSGQMVRRGQRIGSVGNTGLATGPHLHFEVRINGRPVNPLGRL